MKPPWTIYAPFLARSAILYGWSHPFYIDFGELTKIGSKVFINTNCTILDGGGVTIGDDVLIAPNVQIMAAGHPIKADERMVYPFEDEPERMNFVNLAGPITIGNGCWIGAGAIILPNVTIGDRAVIGAGAVVTKNVPADSLAVGNPARVTKKRYRLAFASQSKRLFNKRFGIFPMPRRRTSQNAPFTTIWPQNQGGRQAEGDAAFFQYFKRIKCRIAVQR